MASDLVSEILGPDGMCRSDSGRLVIIPATPEELQSVVTSFADNAQSLHLLEASSSALGRKAPPATIPSISLSRLTAIHEIDAENRIASIQSGVSHRSLANALAKKGLQWPVDTLAGQHSVGTTVVTGTSWVRSLSLPDLRHWLLGSRWLLGRGTFMVSGGKTIKNSAGYDVTRALVGTFGDFAIPIDLQLKLNMIPDIRLTAILKADTELIDTALRKPRGIESIHMRTRAGEEASALIAIAGCKKDIEVALATLQNHKIDWKEAGVVESYSLNSSWMRTGSQVIKWTASPTACADIVIALSQTTPQHSVFSAPLGRWGISSSHDQRKVEDIVSGHGGKTSSWPTTMDNNSVNIPNSGFEEVRRAFDPDDVLI